MCQHKLELKKSVNYFKSTMNVPENRESQSAIYIKNNNNRRKIWELEHNYHCAVIGTCLTLAETRKLVSHFVQDTSDFSDYDFHTYAVHMISFNDKPGKKIQNFLDRKFKAVINHFRKLEHDQLRRQWRIELKSGDVIATFWALITHPCADLEMVKDAYGDIHMMSHLSGAGNRTDIKQLKELRSERNLLREKCVNLQNRFQQELVLNERQRNDLSHQYEENEKISRELVQSRTHLQVLLNKNRERMRQQMEDQFEKLKQQLSHFENLNFKLNQQVNAFNQQESDILNENNKSENQSDILGNDCTECPFGEEDKSQGLCGRCILYVGGRTGMTSHFKQLVENKEGAFLHHDGGMEQSSYELSSLLNKADLVVFPTDCVSHKAYWQLKKACKKQQKPYKVLNSSGVSSFSLLLDELSHD